MDVAHDKLTKESVRFCFDRYKTDMDRIKKYEELVYRKDDYDTWLNNYTLRSEAIRTAYRNNIESDSLFSPFFLGKEEFPEEIADALFEDYLDLDAALYDDPFYAMNFCEGLIDHYTKKNNINHLMLLYNLYGWEASAAYRIGSRECAEKAFDAYKKIISHRDEYAYFTDFKVRRTIFVAYINIICVMPDFGVITVDEAFQYLDEAISFYNSATVQRIDEANEGIKGLISHMRERILSYEEYISDASPETRQKFCTLAREVYTEQCEKLHGEFEIIVEPLVANYRALYLEGRCSYQEAIEYLLAYYRIRCQKPVSYRTGGDYDIDEEYYFQTRLPQTLIKNWLKDPHVLEPVRKHETRYLIDHVNRYFKSISRTSHTSFLNSELTNWCFTILNLLESFEEKENTIFNIVLNRQIQTFFHSYMVANLAQMISESVLRNKPDLFMNAFCVDSSSLTEEKKAEIFTFIKRASLYHDIGKTRITNVINMQHRKLTDMEFALIKKHPAIGADSVDEDFDAYYNIILGHHKHYDGHGGYPDKYSTAGTRDKFLIDVIAICDTLDAATDYFGRNYTVKKTFKDVLSELKAESGRRYCPDIVDLIENDKELYNKIDALLSGGREKEYYRLVIEHL